MCAPIYKLTPLYVSNDEVRFCVCFRNWHMCYDFYMNLQEYLKLVNPSGVLSYDSLWREGRLEAGNGNADEELDAEAGGQSESDAAASLRARAHSFSRSRSRTESSAGSSASPALSAAQMRALLHVQSSAFDSVPSHLVTFFVSNLCTSLPLLEPYNYSIMGEERCACYCTELLMLCFCVLFAYSSTVLYSHFNASYS